MQKNNRERNNAPQRPSAAGKGREGRNAGKPQEAVVAQTKAQAKAARDDAALQQEVDRTVEALRRGGLVLYPTDTVWGLGCDATNAEAVERIYRLKRSENKKSMLVLCATADMVVRYVDKAPAIAFEVMELATSPLTAILPGATGLAANLIPDEGTLGVRIPDHAFCQRMLRAFGRPVVSTSANISGEATPARLQEVAREIVDGVDFVVNPRFEGHPTRKASSIIAFGEGGEVKIIRK
ncbi:L-threonylcarbamoyladenylate synthase [uncultured Alistipes sp.]|uniref:L-threonylcarbamoyladenylate synthase n=1 Tax=uncultured Alistipes sp. TaxID=538949 RepID=UPI00345C3FA0